MKILSILIPELRVIADICTGTHTSKFMCAIYCTYEIINVSKSFHDDWNQVNNRQTFTDRHLLIQIN